MHNFIGPLFIVCSVIMFFTFLRRNFFRRWDWDWIKQGGGLVSHKHIPADYFNAGEKMWFWGGVVLLGLLMSVTGLVLDFVTFGQTRYVLQIANILHIAGATLYIAARIGPHLHRHARHARARTRPCATARSTRNGRGPTTRSGTRRSSTPRRAPRRLRPRPTPGPGQPRPGTLTLRRHG